MADTSRTTSEQERNHRSSADWLRQHAATNDGVVAQAQHAAANAHDEAADAWQEWADCYRDAVLEDRAWDASSIADDLEDAAEAIEMASTDD